jgi:hypothetical protein
LQERAAFLLQRRSSQRSVPAMSNTQITSVKIALLVRFGPVYVRACQKWICDRNLSGRGRFVVSHPNRGMKRRREARVQA